MGTQERSPRPSLAMMREGIRCQQSGWARGRAANQRGLRKNQALCTLRTAYFPRCLSSKPGLVRAANLLLSLRTSHRASQFEQGRAASYLCDSVNSALDHPGRERAGGGGVAVLAHSSRRLPGPQPLHHTLGRARCARGGSRGWGERFYSGVCCLSASRGLGPPYSQVSHTLKQALFLSGLSQVEESIKPPDQGKRRHSGARSEIRRAPGARQRPLQRRTERRRPSHARALAELLPRLLAAPACRPGHLREGR